jgi:sortase A
VAPVPAPLTPRRLVWTGVGWALTVVCAAALVSVLIGALANQRAQRVLLADVRTQINQSAEAAATPFGAQTPTRPPRRGDPVGLLQIPRLGRQSVVVEGSRPGETAKGPGHMAGTAGLGQPGNSVLIGRWSTYGGGFAGLDRLRTGDEIIAITAQGRSVYVVSSATVTGADVTRPGTDDRLTLVTSATRWNPTDRTALVVVAQPRELSFPPTPQNGRDTESDGRSGESSALPMVVIWLALFTITAIGATLLYRRWLSRATYLITTPILVALVVLGADDAIRLLPAWV